MRLFNWLSVHIVLLVAVAGCGTDSPPLDGNELIARARQSWVGDWHAVWQIEWQGAPVRGPLVAEIWHAGDGRLRIETLEAPTSGLNGLIFVDDGQTRWLYDVRHDRWQTEAEEPVRVPLASDALDAIDWLFLHIDDAAVDVSGRDVLESGPSIRLDVVLPPGDRVALWVHDDTGLPARVELRSPTWGEASLVARSVSVPDRFDADLFSSPR